MLKKLQLPLRLPRQSKFAQHKRGPSRKLTIPCVMDRILHVCSTGCSWRDLEVQGGSPKTVYHHFNRWSKLKVFVAEFYDLAKQYSLQTTRCFSQIRDMTQRRVATQACDMGCYRS